MTGRGVVASVRGEAQPLAVSASFGASSHGPMSQVAVPPKEYRRVPIVIVWGAVTGVQCCSRVAGLFVGKALWGAACIGVQLLQSTLDGDHSPGRSQQDGRR